MLIQALPPLLVAATGELLISFLGYLDVSASRFASLTYDSVNDSVMNHTGFLIRKSPVITVHITYRRYRRLKYVLHRLLTAVYIYRVRLVANSQIPKMFTIHHRYENLRLTNNFSLPVLQFSA